MHSNHNNLKTKEKFLRWVETEKTEYFFILIFNTENQEILQFNKKKRKKIFFEFWFLKVLKVLKKFFFLKYHFQKILYLVWKAISFPRKFNCKKKTILQLFSSISKCKQNEKQKEKCSKFWKNTIRKNFCFGRKSRKNKFSLFWKKQSFKPFKHFLWINKILFVVILLSEKDDSVIIGGQPLFLLDLLAF